jgi:hypothetical protein
VYSKRLLLLQVRFARRWLLPLPCWRLQQPLLPMLPDRLPCRLLWFRCSLLLWSLRLQRLLLQPLQCLRLQRWLALFHWLLSQLRWRHSPPLSLQSLSWSLALLQPELRLAFLQLLLIARVLLACPKRLPLWPVRLARNSLLPLQCLQLQRLPLLLLPNRPLWRLLSLHWLLPLQLPM